MRGVYNIVLEILRTDEKARNSDLYLVGKFYERLFNRPIWCISLDEVLAKGVPTYDTITRCRRKATERYPELRGVEIVENERYEKQSEWLDWARS